MDKIKEFMNKGNNRYIIIGGIILVILMILSIVLISNNFGKEEMLTNDGIREIINNKGTDVIYVYNSESSNESGPKILDYLNNNGVKYSVYDVSKRDGSEYVGLLDMFQIDRDVFGYPAIIYIQDGDMFANLININDLNVIDTFIRDYNLKQ